LVLCCGLVVIFSGQALGGDIRAAGKFISDTTTGPPISVSSQDKVVDLNADFIDGKSSEDFATVAALSTASSGIEVHWSNLTGLPGVEINQDCAVNTGCLAGDTAGYPVTISTPGSYRLGGNLTSANEDTTFIEISTSGVTLDLNGFGLFGAVACYNTDSDIACTPAGGTGNGVHVTAATVPYSYHNIIIKNGVIQGMGNNGVDCENFCRLQDLSVAQSGNNGIDSNRPGLIEGCTVQLSNMDGINVSGGTIRDSQSLWNGNDGMVTGAGILSGNYVAGNYDDGIVCQNCVLIDNISAGNYWTGFEFSGDHPAFGRNMTRGNGGGCVLGTAADMGGNICNGSPYSP
jgi:hypothetical protein